VLYCDRTLDKTLDRTRCCFITASDLGDTSASGHPEDHLKDL
jgi:hypothetical protein